MGRILKNYFFWTYQRGTFHYDIMVTLILAFIFITPFLWNYGDRPEPPKLASNSLLVKMAGPGSYTYEVPASGVKAAAPLKDQLQTQIQRVSGAVTLDRFEPVKGSDGRIASYRVWAHR
jgi:hypothetical protein